MIAHALDLLGSAASTVSAWPVHVRDPNGALVARTTLGAIVTGRTTLDAGPFIATLDLPNGTQISHALQFASDGRVDLSALLSKLQVRLSEPGVASMASSSGLASGSLAYLDTLVDQVRDRITAAVGVPPGLVSLLSTAVGKYELLGSIAISAGALIGLGGMGVHEASSSDWKIESWYGTALGRGITPMAPAVLESIVNSDMKRVRSEMRGRPVTVRLAYDGREPMNFILPPATAVIVSPEAAVRVETGHPTIDELLRLLASGRAGNVAALTVEVNADFVRSCLDRPGAALGATYRLLRANAQDLDEALSALDPLVGLSDTLVLRAERAARTGRHAEALPLFLQACTLDLPAFSTGLGFLTDRMRRYAMLGQSRPGRDAEAELREAGLPDTAPAEAQTALAAIQPFGLQCNFAFPIVQYRGTIELHPALLVPEANSS